jgi:biopolymer transport protein ExbD
MAIIHKQGGDTMMSEINVTPLVDVMLVLLTIFIVTAPLLTNAVSVHLPRTKAAVSVTQIKSMRISIASNGDVFLNENKLPIDNLEPELKKNKQGGDLSVEILADEKAYYGAVAKVMTAIQRAGISKFTFNMLPEKSS